MALSNKDLQAIRRRIRLGEQFYEKELKEDFERSLRLYTGDHYEGMRKASDKARVSCNYTLNNIETKVNSVAFRYPQFFLKPKTREAQGIENIAKSAIQCEFKKARVMQELRSGWKDREIYGTGIVYTGWLFTTEDGRRMEDGRQPILEEGPDSTPNPTDVNPPVSYAEVRDDRFFIKRIRPSHFFVSPEAGRDIDCAEYCGYCEVRPLEEVKQDPRYRNTRQLKGTTKNLRSWFDKEMVQEYIEADPDSNRVPDDIKRVKLYHYYEKRRKIHVVMTDEHDKPLLEEKWTWEHDRYPFRVRQNPGDDDCFWGVPSPLLTEHQQKELNEARSQLSDYRRRAVRKFQAPQGILNAKAKKALTSADALDIVEHTSSDPAPIVPIECPSIQPEVFATEDQVARDMQTILGINQYQLGRAPTKRTPTAEVEAIQSQGQARSQYDQQEFESWCAEVAEDCLAWLKMYSVKTRELPIYDSEGNVQAFRDFTREEIRGEYDIEVYVGSTTPPNDAATLESIGFLLQSLNPLIQLALPAQQLGIHLLPLVRQIIKRLPDIRDVDEIIPQAPPMANPMAMAGGAMGEQPPVEPGMEGMGMPGEVGFPPLDDRKVPMDLMAALSQAGGMM